MSSGHRQAKGSRDEEAFHFGRWIRLHGVDLITMALMGALGLGIYEGEWINYLLQGRH
jgi:hypothetical protein